MNAVIKVKAGACAILLGILTATNGPAVAKVTIDCKQPIQTDYAAQQTTKQKAQTAAIHDWSNTVIDQYGAYWADFGKAGNPQFICASSPHGWQCYVTASPCAQVKPLSPSAQQLKFQPQRLRVPQKKRLLKRQRFAPLVRTQHLRSRFRSAAPRSLSRKR